MGTAGKKKSRNYTFFQFIDHDPRMPSDWVPCSPDQLATIVNTMSQMTSEPAIFNILAKQLSASSAEVTAGNKEPDSLKVGSENHVYIMEQKLLVHMHAK